MDVLKKKPDNYYTTMSTVIKSAQDEYEDWRINKEKMKEVERLQDEQRAYLNDTVSPVPALITKRIVRPDTGKKTSLKEGRRS